MQTSSELEVPIPPVPPSGCVESYVRSLQSVLADNEAASVLTELGQARDVRRTTQSTLNKDHPIEAMGILEDAKVGDWSGFRRAILNGSINKTLTSQDFNEIPPGRTFGVIHQIAYHANKAALEFLLEEFPQVDLELKTKNGRTALDLALNGKERAKPDNLFVEFLKERLVSQRRQMTGNNKAKDDGDAMEGGGIKPSHSVNDEAAHKKERSDMPAGPERSIERPMLLARDSVSDISLSGCLDLSRASHDSTFLWHTRCEGPATDATAETTYRSSASLGKLPDVARLMSELTTGSTELGACKGNTVEGPEDGARLPAAATEVAVPKTGMVINVEQKLPPPSPKLHRRLTHTSRSHGPRSLEIWEGDVTMPPEPVDLLVVSSRNGGCNTYCYESVVEFLKRHRNVDVCKISQERRAVDLTAEKKVWISEPLEEHLRFRQLLCVTIVEDGEDGAEVIHSLEKSLDRVFESIALVGQGGESEGPRSIAIPLIGHTFVQDPSFGCSEEDVAKYLVAAAKKALENSRTCDKIMLYGFEKKHAELLEKALMDSIFLWGDDTPKDQPEDQPNASLKGQKQMPTSENQPTKPSQRSEEESDCVSLGPNDVVLGETWVPNAISTFYKKEVRRKVKVKDRDGLCRELRKSFDVSGIIRFWKSREKAESCIACQQVSKGQHLCNFRRKNGDCVTLVQACDDCIKKDSSNRNQQDRKPKKPRIAPSALAAARHSIVSDSHGPTDRSSSGSGSENYEGDSSGSEESNKINAKCRGSVSKKKERRKVRGKRSKDDRDDDDEEDASDSGDDIMAEYEMFKKFMELKRRAQKKAANPKKKRTRR